MGGRKFNRDFVEFGTTSLVNSVQKTENKGKCSLARWQNALAKPLSVAGFIPDNYCVVQPTRNKGGKATIGMGLSRKLAVVYLAAFVRFFEAAR